MAKYLTKEKIDKLISLRRTGCSIPEIARDTKTSYGSVYRHVNNIEILPQFLEKWKRNQGGSTAQMLKRRKIAVNKAEKDIQTLSNLERKVFLAA